MPSRRSARRLTLSARSKIGSNHGHCIDLSQDGLRWVGIQTDLEPKEVILELEPGYEVSITGTVVWTAIEGGLQTLGFKFDRPLPTIYGWFKMMEAA